MKILFYLLLIKLTLAQKVNFNEVDGIPRVRINSTHREYDSDLYGRTPERSQYPRKKKTEKSTLPTLDKPIFDKENTNSSNPPRISSAEQIGQPLTLGSPFLNPYAGVGGLSGGYAGGGFGGGYNPGFIGGGIGGGNGIGGGFNPGFIGGGNGYFGGGYGYPGYRPLPYCIPYFGGGGKGGFGGGTGFGGSFLRGFDPFSHFRSLKLKLSKGGGGYRGGYGFGGGGGYSRPAYGAPTPFI